MLTTTDIPDATLSVPVLVDGDSDSNRWATLVKFAVALSAGENRSICPCNSLSGRASTTKVAGWPTFMPARWVSLKFATTQKRFGTTVRNGNLSLRLATKLSGEIARRAVGRKSSDRH